MSVLRIPAARVRRGDLVLYTTSIRVADLVKKDFYNVETLDPVNDRGFQRLLNTARAKKLADYILKGQDTRDAFLPTSVFLATNKDIKFNESDHTIEFDSALIGPFSVVDGQHRLEGLKLAADLDKRVLGFEVAVNIAPNLPYIAQMAHFLIVNTTQKSVDAAVEQRIITRLSEAIGLEDVPSLPKWILKLVEKGEVAKAVKLVDFLNREASSPWRGKIEMANDLGDEETAPTVKQRTFVRAIVKYVLTANNPLSIVDDETREQKVFLNYWKSIASLLDDGSDTVLYKYNGVELFCKFSIPFFVKLQDKGNFTVATMTQTLKSCFESMAGDHAGVGHPDWWASGGKASGMNAAALNIVFQEMSKALHRASAKADIVV
jgi:DGQHR domain-containing protein